MQSQTPATSNVQGLKIATKSPSPYLNKLHAFV